MLFRNALKVLIPVAGLLLGSQALNAGTTETAKTREEVKAKINTLGKDHFIEYYKNVHQRTPKAVNMDLVKKIAPNTSKSVNQILSGTKMPAKVVVPGEFEEVQAIMMTWPYYSVDANNDPADGQLFAGYSLEVVNNQYTGKLIPVTNYIDLFDDSPYPPIFSKLANAIDNETEVWINIWAAEDSTAIINYMNKAGMPLKHARFFVNPGNSFWYRDCGPVACYFGDQDSVGLIDFEYYGGRPLDDQIPVQVGKKMGIPVFTNTIEYEGGNILVDGAGKLFTSTAVTLLNADSTGLWVMDTTGGELTFGIEYKKPLTKQQVIDSLTSIMNLNKCQIVNELKYDGGTGHIDLYADLYDENIFVFSQMPDAMKNFADYKTVSKNVDTLVSISTVNGPKFQKRYIGFPTKDDGTWYKSSSEYNNNYTRTYSNHTFVNNTIIQPVFYNEETGNIDGGQADIEQLKTQYPGYKIAPIDIRTFDGYGGAIHCITKQIPAENPVRIFHFPIDKTQLSVTGTEFPINATITNKSGIATATFKWRVKGETDWKSIVLTAGANNTFTSVLPAKTGVESETIEYYITATSKNGKTINKPFPAPAGFYTFAYGSKVSVEDANTDASSSEFYPNPASSQVSLKLDASFGASFNMTIYNAMGEAVYSNRLTGMNDSNVININADNLSEGAYFVNFQLESGKVITKKLVVKK